MESEGGDITVASIPAEGGDGGTGNEVAGKGAAGQAAATLQLSTP